MKKRGQVSVFIIIGILIIGLIAGFFAFKNKIDISNLTGTKKISPELSQIDKTIEDCAKQRTIDAIRIIGLQGGYINLPEKYLITNLTNIAYGYYEGKKTLASKSIIENEISYYIETAIPYCINKNNYPEFNLTIGTPKSKTSIDKNSVIISSELPISAKKSGSAFTINRKYKSEILIKLNDILYTANEIINKEIEDPKNIQLSYLSSLDYYVMVLPENENEIVYVITDNNSRIDDIPYSFVFANKMKNNQI